MSDSLRPHGLQYSRLPCPSATPRVYSNSRPLRQWCHPIISHSVIPFSHLQSFPTSGSFPLSQFFALGGQSVSISASASGISQFTYCWSFTLRILSTLRFYFASVWNECNCAVVWTFFGIFFCLSLGLEWKPVVWTFFGIFLPFFGIGMKTDLFQSCGHCWVFQICWHIEGSTFTAASFRIWNSSAGIPSPPLAWLIVMFPKTYLTSPSKMSGSRWVITPSWLSESLRYLLYSSSMYSCYLFFIFSASVRSKQFLSFIEPIFAWNVPLVSLIFLKRLLVFPILLFSSISLHWSLRKAFLSLPDVLWNSAFRWVYLSFSPLPFISLLFLSSTDNTFTFLHLFFLERVLVTACSTMLWTSVHSSSGTLSIRFSPLNLFVTSAV